MLNPKTPYRPAYRSRVAVIEEAANRRRACGVGFASTGAVCAPNASRVTGAAATTERGETTSPAADGCGGARLEEKRKKLYGYQCVGVILLGSIFSDPFTRLSRPASGLIGPTGVILENDDFSISLCGLERLAHAKDAYFDGVVGGSLRDLYFRNTQTLFHPWHGSSTPIEVPILAEGFKNHRG